MIASSTPIRPLAIAFAAAGLMVAGCQRDEPAAPPPAAPAPAPVLKPVAPLPPPVLNRVELVAAIEQAASDYVAGQTAGQGLVGRRFSIRQAFGCLEPVSAQAADGLAGWSWGKRKATIELTLLPADWMALAPGDWEAVEGFWLARPWQRGEGCPAGRWTEPAPDEPPAPSAQTVGLAAVFEPGGSRMGRRSGRAYAFTVRGEAGQPPVAPVAGYRLMLEGRLGAFDDGQAIHCAAEGPERRPVCIAAVRLDRVAFEDANGVVLSEWR